MGNGKHGKTLRRSSDGSEEAIAEISYFVTGDPDVPGEMAAVELGPPVSAYDEDREAAQILHGLLCEGKPIHLRSCAIYLSGVRQMLSEYWFCWTCGKVV